MRQLPHSLRSYLRMLSMGLVSLCKMQVPTAMLRRINTALQLRWVFYTQYTVRTIYLLSGIIIWQSAIGAGALVAPLVSTQFAQMPRWSFHYLTSLGIALSNTIMLIAVFRFKTQDGKIHSQLHDITLTLISQRPSLRLGKRLMNTRRVTKVASTSKCLKCENFIFSHSSSWSMLVSR